MAATVAALGGECSQAVVNDSAVAAAVAVDGARGVDSGASDTADSLGCLPPRLRSLCERYKVTVAEAASLLAWLFTGFSFVIAKRAFDDCSPLLFQALRFTAGAVFLLFIYRKRLSALRNHYRGSIIVGTLVALGYVLQSLSLNLISPTRNAFLTSLCVPLTPLIISVVTRKLPPLLIGIAAAMAGLGTWLLTDGGGSGWSTGDNLMIGCAVIFAIHFIALNHYCTQAPDAPDALAFGQIAVGTLVSWAFVPLDLVNASGLYLRGTPALISGIFITGCLATGGSFAMLSWAQPHVSASRTAVICATEPLFAALAAFLIFNESLSSPAMGGGGIILGAIVVSSIDGDTVKDSIRKVCCSHKLGVDDAPATQDDVVVV